MRSNSLKALAGFLCFLPFALHAADNFDYSYRVMSGGLPLTQVFDDGQKSYLVIPSNTDRKTMDAIVKSLTVSKGGQEVPATVEASSPYLIISGVHEKISVTVKDRRAVAIYMGNRAPAPAPEKSKAETTPAERAKAPKAAPTNPSALERKELLPDSRSVVKVVAPTPAPMPGSAPVRPEPAARPAAKPTAGPEENEIAHYKVLVPFAPGKTALGKDGEKAVKEIANMGQIAKSIVIRIPAELNGNPQTAHGRAAEIYKSLVKTGLVRQRFVIDVLEAQPDNQPAVAEVTLMIDIGPRTDK